MKKKVYFVLSIISLAIMAFMSVKLPLIIQKCVDAVIEKEYIVMYDKLKIVIMLSVLTVIVAMLRVVFEVAFENAVKHELRGKLLVGLTNKKLQDFTVDENARYVSIFNNEIDMVYEDYYLNAVDICGCMITALMSVTALCQINIAIGMIIFTTCILIAIAPQFFKKSSQKVRMELTHNLKKYNGLLKEFLEGMSVIREYGYIKKFLSRLTGQSENINKSMTKRGRINCKVNATVIILQKIQDVMIILIGVSMIKEGNMTAGQLLAAVSLASVMSTPITYLASLFSIRNSVKPVVDELKQIMSIKQDKVYKQVNRINKIELKKLSIRFEDKVVLDEVDYTFDANNKYLIMGESGSGKSTLLKILSMEQDNYIGDVLIDGKSLANISEKDYFSHINIVHQEAFMLYDTVIENIKMDKKLDDDIIKNVGVKLNISDLLDKEDATVLSGGEKQRVSLARALADVKDFIILDEVTSSLDRDNAIRVEDALLNGIGTGMINVSHKPVKELMEKYDVILELKNGKLIELQDEN